MTPDGATLSLGGAFLAGLAASGHCIGMCGGIAGALSIRNPGAGRGARLGMAVAYNLARITSYSVAGGLAGALGGALLHAVDVTLLASVLRVTAGLIMFAVAARLLFGWRLLDPLESTGARLWRRIAPWAGRQGHRGGLAGAVALGLAWGCLPCGMTYSMLLLAATTADAALGAAVMLVFGLGTLPSMTTATVAFERLARSLSRGASLRRIAGILLLAFGAWTAGNALHHASAGHGAHPVPQPRDVAAPHHHPDS